MKYRIALLGVIFSMLISPIAFSKQLGLYERFNGKAVKVFVAPVQDSTGEKVVNAATLKSEIELALQGRKSISFVLAPTEEASDIVIHTDISEYLWTDTDPIDMLMGVGGAAMDAAVTEDYARLQANMTVTDTKKKKDLWKDRIMATVTKKPMSQADSIPLVSADFAKTFVKTAFGKTKK